MSTPAGSRQPPPVGDEAALFRATAARVFEIADQGRFQSAFISEVLEIFRQSAGADRVSLRLPEGTLVHCWTLTAWGGGQVEASTAPLDPADAADSEGCGDWHSHLPGDLVGTTPLGSLWTGPAGLEALHSLSPNDCPPHLRGVVHSPSSASVLLIPVIVGTSPSGRLQFESRLTDAFSPGMTRALEGATHVFAGTLSTQSARWALEERVKELSCLYKLARLTERSDLTLSEILEQIAMILPPAWQHPDVASARIVVDEVEVLWPRARSVRDVLTAPIRCHGDPRGVVQVMYAEARPSAVEGPFLAEERSLLDIVAIGIGRFLERHGAAEDRRRLERQLQHADRLATIGQLAAGVAHELNEPLGTSLGFAQLIAKDSRLPGEIGEDVDRIVRASLHAREIIRKLMAFGRQIPPRSERVDLGRVVTDGLYFLEARCAKQGVALEKDVGVGDCFVQADASQVQQVVVNLVVNALHAMPKGGHLVVRVVPEAEEVRLEVVDTGTGMPREVVEQIFTPFFTTKDVGEGTGLGLSVVHGIVTEHGGRIDVTSHPGKGDFVRHPAPGRPPPHRRGAVTEAASDTTTRILVVDDTVDTLELIRRNLTAVGYVVDVARGVSEALSHLEGNAVDIVLTDLKMPHIGGLDLVRHVRENLRDTEVILMTGYASIEGAVEAMKTGADDYLAKPFTDEELLACVMRVREKLRVRRAGRSSGVTPALSGMLGTSDAMLRVYQLAERAASSDATVLVTGESGTGKELVARAMHYRSTRSAAPFVPVNCGGIPEGLLESELFGHVRGAFTGATATRAGFFQTAEGGTIFLDEVGELPMSMQVKLLRVLQDGVVAMVGSSRSRAVDIRIVAATNKDLPTAIRAGTFREDLFFRINVLAIDLPPLRERGDDVLVLARHFADRFAAEASRENVVVTEAALRALQAWPWPGNVRELENVVRRALVMGEGDAIDVVDLPAPMRFIPARNDMRLCSLAEVEAAHLRAVWTAVGENKTRAAAILGIDRKTLRQKLRALEEDGPGRNSPAG